MKHFVFCTLVAFLFCSCSKEESSNDTQLQGTWKVESIDADPSLFPSWDYTFTFSSKGKCSVVRNLGGGDFSGSYVREGDQVSLYVSFDSTVKESSTDGLPWIVFIVQNRKGSTCDFSVTSAPFSSQYPYPVLHVVKQ